MLPVPFVRRPSTSSSRTNGFAPPRDDAPHPPRGSRTPEPAGPPGSDSATQRRLPCHLLPCLHWKSQASRKCTSAFFGCSTTGFWLTWYRLVSSGTPPGQPLPGGPLRSCGINHGVAAARPCRRPIEDLTHRTGYLTDYPRTFGFDLLRPIVFWMGCLTGRFRTVG